MREKKPYTVLTFRSTTDALALERICKAQGIPGRMIPVPREISADCGLAWRITDPEYESWRETLEGLHLTIQEVAHLLL